MLKRILLSGTIVLSLLNIFNGYYQTTKVEFENIEGTCYGTLLSEKTVSGSWDSKLSYDYPVPEEILSFFESYEDPDRYSYLNYLQDVSEGLLYWPFYPPEKFKVLLYWPDTQTYAVSEKPIERYALNSTYKADISDGTVHLVRNYNYGRLVAITLIRIAVLVTVSFLVTLLYTQSDKKAIRSFFLSTVPFQTILNLLISVYSFRNGFSVVEYYLFLWIPYILFFLLQGYIYRRKTNLYRSPFLCSFFGNLSAYAVGLLMADVIPALFTVL